MTEITNITPKKQEPERYIYKALRPFTLGVLPARRRPVTDGSGAISWGAPTKSVKVVFNQGTFEINKEVAASYTKPDGMPFSAKELKEVLEANMHFGGRFKKVYDSTTEQTPEQVEFSKKADSSNKERGTKTTLGA